MATSSPSKLETTAPIQNDSSLSPQTPPENDQLNSPPKSPVVGNEIQDSEENGKTCHQCRQKKKTVVASCTNQINEKKRCTLNVCQNCLSNRYGENAEEVAQSGDWKCPRCRDICNCSFCMRKKGWGPTGVLVYTAKKNGFASVSNLLNVSGCNVTKMRGTPKKRSASDQETEDEPERKLVKEEENGESEEDKNTTDQDTTEDHNPEIQLPQGTELTNVAGIDLPSGDVGHALQLLEFCGTFGEILQLKAGDPEILLRELACTDTHDVNESFIVQFHTDLLSLIEEDSGKKFSGKSWMDDFKECICESQCPTKKSLLEFFNLQLHGYDELNLSKKLRLLNFLCDEALGTVKLRLWIEERNMEEKKKAKEKLIANREKEKNMKKKKKVQDEVAKAILLQNGIPLSITEKDDIVLKVKAEIAQTLANSLEMREVSRESYVVRSEPIHVDINGCKLWKLRSHSDKIGMLLQDSCYGDGNTSDEKWFAYSDQEKALVDEYVSNSSSVYIISLHVFMDSLPDSAAAMRERFYPKPGIAPILSGSHQSMLIVHSIPKCGFIACMAIGSGGVIQMHQMAMLINAMDEERHVSGGFEN